MNNPYQHQVAEFYAAKGTPDGAELLARLIQEEAGETKAALEKTPVDLALVLDGLCDLLYCVAGIGNEFGFDILSEPPPRSSTDALDWPAEIGRRADALVTALREGRTSLATVTRQLTTVIFACAADLGITDLQPYFAEVHRSNMTKLVRLARPDGKRVKGAAYERPRLRQILAEHDPVLLAAQGLIVELVLTGGAGSGKTTVLPLIAAALREQGWRVLVRPEVASMILSGVPDIATIIEAEPVRYQVIETAMIGMRLDLRRRYLVIAQALAERGERVAVVYERAEPDAEAYLGTARYEQVLAGLGTAKAAVRDSYQAVIHMVSAAVGAEDAYTRTNNAARFESVEAAARSEVRTRQAWSGHRRLVIIDSDSDLDRKLSRTVSTALALVNASVREIRRADP